MHPIQSDKLINLNLLVLLLDTIHNTATKSRLCEQKHKISIVIWYGEHLGHIKHASFICTTSASKMRSTKRGVEEDWQKIDYSSWYVIKTAVHIKDWLLELKLIYQGRSMLVVNEGWVSICRGVYLLPRDAFTTTGRLVYWLRPIYIVYVIRKNHDTSEQIMVKLTKLLITERSYSWKSRRSQSRLLMVGFNVFKERSNIMV